MAINDPKVGDGLSGTALSADHIGNELNRVFENLLAEVLARKGGSGLTPVLQQGSKILNLDATELTIGGSPLVSEARLQEALGETLDFTPEQIEALQSLAQEIGDTGSLLDLQASIDLKVAQADYDARVTSVDGELDSLSASITSHAGRLNVLEGSDFQGQIDALVLEQATQDTAIQSGAQLASVANVRSLTNETAITSLNTQMATAQSDIIRTEGKADANATSIAGHSTQLTALSASVTSATSKNTEQDGRLATNEASIVALQTGKLDSNATAVSALRLANPQQVQISGDVAGGVTSWSGNTALSFSLSLTPDSVKASHVDETQSYVMAGLRVNGDLLVTGAVNSVDSTVLHVEDASIFLRKGATTTGDSFIRVEQGAGVDDAELFYNSASNRYEFRLVDDNGDESSTQLSVKAGTFIGDLQGQADTVASLTGLDADDLPPSATRLWLTQEERTTISEVANLELDGYVTDTELTSALADYALSSDVTTALGSYYTSAQTDTLLGAKVDSSSLATTLGSYYTSAQTDSLLGNYLSAGDLSTELSSYVTSASLSTTLGGYVTSGVLATTLDGYVTPSSLATELSAYVSSTSLNTTLSGYVSSSALSTALGDYYLSSQVDSLLGSYVTSTGLTTALSGYVTSTGLTTVLGGYVTSTGLTATLADYATTASLGSYLTTADLTGYVTSSALATELGSYVTSTALSVTLGDYATTASLGDYLTSADLADYVTTSDLGTYLTADDLTGYVTSSDLTTALSSYVTSTGLATALAGYATSADLNAYITVDDLDGYVTSSELANELLSYVTSSALTTALAGYLTPSDLTTTLNGYVTSSALSSTLGDYYLASEIDTTLGSYVTATGLSTTLNGYVTSAGLASSLSGYVSSDTLTTELSAYVTSTALTTTLASYVTATSLATSLGGYYTASDVDVLLGSYVTSTALSTALGGYYTKSQVDSSLSSYVTSTALSTSLANYYTKAQIDTTFSGYVTSAGLTSALSDYVTSASLSALGYLDSTSAGAIFYSKTLSDARYYTQSQVDGLLAGKASAQSVSDVEADLAELDSNTYSKSEVDALVDAQVSPTELSAELASYAPTSITDGLDSRVTTAEGDIASLEAGKVDKVEGKELSSNDFTDAEQAKLGNMVFAYQLAGGTAWTRNGDVLTFGNEIDQHTGAWKITHRIVDGEILFDYALRSTTFNRFTELPDRHWPVNANGDLSLSLT